MCVRVIGDKTGLDDDIRKRIAELEEATKDNTGLHFQIAINYGGRDEIRRAVTNLAMQSSVMQKNMQIRRSKTLTNSEKPIFPSKKWKINDRISVRR